MRGHGHPRRRRRRARRSQVVVDRRRSPRLQGRHLHGAHRPRRPPPPPALDGRGAARGPRGDHRADADGAGPVRRAARPRRGHPERGAPARPPRSWPARAARSRSPRAASGRAVCTTACGSSASPRRRSSSPASARPARVAFGKPIANLGGNRERLARARIAINQARLLVLHAAWKLDTVGIEGAQSEVSEIKAAVPQMACDVIDLAIQLHGGGGMSEDFPLAAAYAGARSLRLADGPDEVHLGRRRPSPAASVRRARGHRRGRRGRPPGIEPPECPMSRRVLVTGGASGLGLALTELMVARGDTVLVVDLAEERPDTVPEGAAYRRLDVRSPAGLGRRAGLGAREVGRPRPARQQRGRGHRGPHRRRGDLRLGAGRRHQPARRRARLPHVHAAVQGAAQRPHRQRRLARRARPRPGHGELQRDQGRGRRHQRDAVLRARAVGHRRLGVCPAFFRTNLHRVVRGQGRRDAGGRDAPHHPGQGRRRSTSPRSCSRASTRARGSSSPTGSATRRTSPSASPGRSTTGCSPPRPSGSPAVPAPTRRTSCRERRSPARAPVRDEDAFDVERVATWLRENAPGEAGLDGMPEVQPVRRWRVEPHLPAAVRRWAGCRWSRPHPAPPPGGHQGQGAPTTCGASTTSRRPWPRCFPAVPRMVAFCGDDDVIGSEFYVMERIEGTILRRDVPAEARPRPRRRGRAVPHRDRHAGRPARRRRRGRRARPRSTVATATCAGRSRAGAGRYRRARTDDVGDFEATMAWLEAHQPAGPAARPRSTTTSGSTTSCSTRPTRPGSSACSTGRWRPSATR